MDLMDLVVLACTLASQAACHEYHLLYQSVISPRTCTMQAQPYLAQWIGEHPNLRVARWYCAWPSQEDRKT
jgi:P2-related tail formation protein